MNTSPYHCPVCNSKALLAKYEAKYVYSYIIDSDVPGLHNTDSFFPFLYDKRDKTEARQYIECESCKSQFPCTFNEESKGIDSKAFKEAMQRDLS